MPDRNERARGANGAGVVAGRERVREVVQRSEAAPRGEIGEKRGAYDVAALPDLLRQLPADARPAGIRSAREPPAEDRAADKIVPGRRKAYAESEQRAGGGQRRSGIVVFACAAKRAHQRRCTIERELRSFANEKHAETACRPESDDGSS